MKAVIDRFEEDHAILLLGDAEERLVVPRKALPRAAEEGHWLQVEVRNGALVCAAIDEQETARARQRIIEKLERLRRGDHLK